VGAARRRITTHVCGWRGVRVDCLSTLFVMERTTAVKSRNETLGEVIHKCSNCELTSASRTCRESKIGAV
jgi:hypothetical protein